MEIMYTIGFMFSGLSINSKNHPLQQLLFDVSLGLICVQLFIYIIFSPVSSNTGLGDEEPST